MPGCDDCAPKELTHATPAYRRALWLVVFLNLGTGVAETVVGFLAGSQSLKADALDFLGDGSITLLALLATRWGPVWRSRMAAAQGLFLALLGIGVLLSTAYRVLVANQPEAGPMGVMALVGLAANVASAWVLLPHRAGDANVRAVWLFSRNDALSNLAVLAAAGLVALTGTRWPDLAVAVVVAGLFLHSAWEILARVRSDRRNGQEHPGPKNVPPAPAVPANIPASPPSAAANTP